MTGRELLNQAEALTNQAKDLADQAVKQVDEYSGVLGSIERTIVEHFGQNGLIATYISLAVVILFVASRLAKVGFSTLKYLVLPAVGLAVLGSFVLPFTFYFLLPITVTACSLLLLFKG